MKAEQLKYNSFCNFSLWLKATSPLVWFQTNFDTWERTWSVYQSTSMFLCNFPRIPLRPCSKKVYGSDPIRSGDTINHSGVLRLRLLPWLWKDFGLHFKVCDPLFVSRIFVGDAICGSGAGKGERRRQAGGAVVPGAVETDLERGQRHHWSRIAVWGANWSSPVVFEEINQQFGVQS